MTQCWFQLIIMQVPLPFDSFFFLFLFLIKELNIFNMVLRDIFYSLPKPPTPAYHITKVVQDFESVLLTNTKEKGFVPHRPWITKIHQLWTLSKVHRGKSSFIVSHFPNPIPLLPAFIFGCPNSLNSVPNN